MWKHRECSGRTWECGCWNTSWISLCGTAAPVGMRCSSEPAKTQTKPPKPVITPHSRQLHPAASLKDRTVETLEKSQFLWCPRGWKTTVCPGREETDASDPRDQAHIPLPGCGDPSTGTRRGFSSHQTDTQKAKFQLQPFPFPVCTHGSSILFFHNFEPNPLSFALSAPSYRIPEAQDSWGWKGPLRIISKQGQTPSR